MTARTVLCVHIPSPFWSTHHLAKRDADGAYVPRCGTRTRVADLEVSSEVLGMVDCERCQKIMRREGVL